MKSPGISEHALQIAIRQFLDVVIHPPYWYTAIDHAGKLGPRQAAMRKRRGVKRGIADFLVMGPGPNVLWLEIKRPGGGSLTPEQKAFAKAMHGCQAWFVLCRSVQDVQGALEFVRLGRRLNMRQISAKVADIGENSCFIDDAFQSRSV